ncbi:nucleolar protein 8 [Chanos chanos]|uniref:Nucleolar protein 8 n=1 Tax=Chanos chanos TaxID=29144 RepID=A0A6J2VLZ7_CHACN|nr:nucleolar protein 8 [Chanos chanos]
MRRLYIGGLSHNISQKDLKDRFGKFGQVSDVEIVTRKDGDGVPVKTFGYINIDISDGDYKRCLSVLNKSKWKGGTLQIELAKESFLHRLAEERQQVCEKSQAPRVDPKEEIVESFKKAGVENFHMKAAVPGTEVPGHKDWVVSKFGRVLPVLQLKCQGKNKIFKYDPSKHCHNIKKLENAEDSTDFTPVSKLTWEILGGDDEISKKRRGEFPQRKVCPKKFKKDSSNVLPTHLSDHIEDVRSSVNIENAIVSKNRTESGLILNDKQSSVVRMSQKAVCVFDSDADSDDEIRMLVATESVQNTTGLPAEEDDTLEVVGNDFTVKSNITWGQRDSGSGMGGFTLRTSKDDEEYDSADTDEILTQSKTTNGPKDPHMTEPDTKNQNSIIKSDENKVNVEGKTADKSTSKPLPVPSDSESIDEESSSSVESDYEDIMTNCYRIELSLTDLEQLAKNCVASSDDENSDIVDSDPQTGPSRVSNSSSESKMKTPCKAPQKSGNNPDDILASLLGDSSDEENDGGKKGKKKERLKKGKTSSLPAFVGTKDLFKTRHSAESDFSLKRQDERENCQSTDDAKSQKQDSKILTHREVKDEGKDTQSCDPQLKDSSSSLLPVDRGDEEMDEECDNVLCNDGESTDDLKQLSSTVEKSENSVPKTDSSQKSDTSSDDSGSSEDEVKQKARAMSREGAVSEKSTQGKIINVSKADSLSCNNEVIETKENDKAATPKDSGHTEQAHKIPKCGPTADSLCSSSSATKDSVVTEESVVESNVKAASEGSDDSQISENTALVRRPPQRTAVSDAQKQQQDNQRRLAALEQRQKEAEQQKKLIQGALAGVDTPSSSKSKHIVFDSDDESDDKEEDSAILATQKKDLFQEDPESDREMETENTERQELKEKTRGNKLFDSSDEEEEDDDNDDEERFQIKPQFEGKAGQKLMELQSRFGTDERFQMDSRFLDSDNECEVQDDKPSERTAEEELIEEKRKNLDILQSVLNIDIQPSDGSKGSAKNKMFRDISALHYDPTREEHAAFETKKEEPKKESKAARRKKREEAEKLPEVSKDIYYDVAVNLKEVFGTAKENKEETVINWDKEEEKEDEVETTDENKDIQLSFSSSVNTEKQESTGFTFSFLTDDTVGESTPKTDEYKIETLRGAKISWQVDPRFQDSSSEEEEEEEEEEEMEVEANNQTASTNSTVEPESTKKKLFFFYQDDERLKEGPKMFCRSTKLEDQREEWEGKRTSLIEEYRKKHKDAKKRLKASHRS